MRKKAVEIRTMKAQERIEAKIDFMIRMGGYDPETFEPLGRDWKEPEAPAGEDLVPPAETASDGVPPVEVTPAEPPAEPPVEPPADEPPVEPPVEEKPRTRGKNK
jgi:hypothetical protein